MGAEDFPFCSERCRLIDLGRWADEEYKIPAVELERDSNVSQAASTDDDA